MSYQDIHPMELPPLLGSNELIIFDTRDANSFAQGHLQGAMPISDAEIKRLIVTKQRTKPVLVYCYHGNSSRDICSLLGNFGFSEVYNLEGGWQAWRHFVMQ